MPGFGTSIRLAALMGLHVIHVFTHDSLALGEDGPTHQPIEQLASLRAIPKLTVIRPADANETAVAWKVAVETRDRPVLLVLTRQDLPTLDRTRYASAEGLRRGAYVLRDPVDREPMLILMASGSEVTLILAAADRLDQDGIAVRCVSVPSWDLFDAQPPAYRDQVLPPGVTARLGVELGVEQGWHRYVGDRGDILAIDRFGASAPAEVLLEKFGFTLDHVVARARVHERRPGNPDRISAAIPFLDQNVRHQRVVDRLLARNLARHELEFAFLVAEEGAGMDVDAFAAVLGAADCDHVALLQLAPFLDP